MTSPSLPLIGVTGASGAVGGLVAAALSSAGVAQRLVGRDPARLPVLPGATAGPAAQYRDTAAMTDALRGVRTMLLVSGRESADRLDEHRSAIDAAAAAGVARIVYTSFQGAAPDGVFTFGRDHFHTEQHLRASGLAWTFLRDGFYLDVLPAFATAGGVIAAPAGDGAVAGVSQADVAACAVRVLRDAVLAGDPGATPHDGATYELTGPAALTLAEVAAELTRVSGREVRYEAETEEQAHASRASYGAPDFEVRGWVTSYRAIAAGEVARVTGDVEALTGRRPESFAEVLARRPGVWAHLRG